jgi:hypothetical protein
MKSRGFVRPYLFQAIKRGESVVVTDPKSELYTDTAELFRKNGYTVKVFNLVDPAHGDSWNAMSDLNGDTLMAQVLTSVIITNTSGERGDLAEDSPALQTDPETPEENAEGVSAPEQQSPGDNPDAEIPPVLQTDSKTAENAASGAKPRRKRAKTREDGEEKSQSDSEDAAPDSTPPQARTRTARRSRAILSIDEERTVATQSDNVKSDLLDLVESLKARKILTGTVQGVERSEDNPDICYAVLYHGEFKVIIPANEFVDPPEDFRDRKPSDVMHQLHQQLLVGGGADMGQGILRAVVFLRHEQPNPGLGNGRFHGSLRGFSSKRLDRSFDQTPL